jgi:hypothetical protein
LSGFQNRLRGFGQRFWQAKVFIAQSWLLSQASFFGNVRFLKLARLLSLSKHQGFQSAVWQVWFGLFYQARFFLAKVLRNHVIFLASVLTGLALALSIVAVSVLAKSALPKTL